MIRLLDLDPRCAVIKFILPCDHMPVGVSQIDGRPYAGGVAREVHSLVVLDAGYPIIHQPVPIGETLPDITHSIELYQPEQPVPDVHLTRYLGELRYWEGDDRVQKFVFWRGPT